MLIISTTFVEYLCNFFSVHAQVAIHKRNVARARVFVCVVFVQFRSFAICLWLMRIRLISNVSIFVHAFVCIRSAPGWATYCPRTSQLANFNMVEITLDLDRFKFSMGLWYFEQK